MVISLSPRAQNLITILAQDEGRKSGSTQLLPEHVMLALLKSANSVGYAMLGELHINILEYKTALEQAPGIFGSMPSINEIPASSRLSTMLDIAMIESRALQNNYIGTEHLVLAAIREEGSATANFFRKSNISIEEARKSVPRAQAGITPSTMERDAHNLAKSIFQNLLSNGDGTLVRVQQENSQSTRARQKQQQQQQQQQPSFIQEFSRDITYLAREGLLDPVVGRDKEIHRLVKILSRRTKNNPILVGDPGVGKTAIVEGLAQRIAKGNVPSNLAKKQLLALDMAALVAGTKYRGEFEERMKRVMKETRENKNIILFIDELHTIIGAGGPEGAMDASNLIKPALSRGEIQVVGATTTREYTRYIERDTALERRFQVVKIGEPCDDDTISILEGIKSQFEEYHHVSYNADVIPAIVKLSRRYLPERCLPDKAIDILDEAGSAKKIEDGDRPKEFAELEESIAALVEEKRSLVENQDYEKAAVVRDKVLELRRQLEYYRQYWDAHTASHRRSVTVNDVAHVIGEMTGIPVEQLDSSESKRLVHMEEELHKTVIGQDEAVHLIAGAIRRNRAGISSPKHPMGSFIFLGPTGVGKTQLAKTLAKFLFGSEEMLVRIDMSDYMEKHNTSRLVGAPPGYVGYEDGGILTDAVRRHPYSVVLLDEIEKAHPDVFNLLLQLLEEGELTDSHGHVVNFRNTVVIMTSNAGARQITNAGKVGFSTTENGEIKPYDEIKSDALNELKKLLNPELINRINDIVVFTALSREQVGKILDIQFNELAVRVAEKNISISMTDEAHEYFVENGYEPEMGARPMRRLIQREIEEPLAIEILDRERRDTENVVVELSDGKIRVRFLEDADGEKDSSVQEQLVANVEQRGSTAE